MQQAYTRLKTAILKAGKHAQQIRQSGLSVTIKGRQDFVSEADLSVENRLKKVIQELFPNDAFLGEESGLIEGLNKRQDLSNIEEQNKTQEKNNSAYGIWVIDPIDGTTNYLQGMDYWCISVAYVVKNKIEIGFVYAPDRNEFFFAEHGKGAYLNELKLSISEPEAGQAIIGVGRSNRRPLLEYLQLLTTLDTNNIEHRRFGAGALMLAHVSSGLVNGYYESHLNSWDALAGLLLIEEAGGKISDFLKDDGLIVGNPVWAASPQLWHTFKQLSN